MTGFVSLDLWIDGSRARSGSVLWIGLLELRATVVFLGQTLHIAN